MKFVSFLKLRVIFNVFYGFWMFANQTFHKSHVRISQKVKGDFNVKSSTYYFHMKTKILADFQTCISVPLKLLYPRWKNFALSYNFPIIQKYDQIIVIFENQLHGSPEQSLRRVFEEACLFRWRIQIMISTIWSLIILRLLGK